MHLGSPVDVSRIVDFTVDTSDSWITALVLDVDGGETQVRAHGEVGNSCNHGHSSCDVVEYTVGSWLHLTHCQEGEGAHSHDSADCEVPVRAMSGDSDLGNAVVDIAIVR